MIIKTFSDRSYLYLKKESKKWKSKTKRKLKDYENWLGIYVFFFPLILDWNIKAPRLQHSKHILRNKFRSFISLNGYIAHNYIFIFGKLGWKLKFNYTTVFVVFREITEKQNYFNLRLANTLEKFELKERIFFRYDRITRITKV